MKKVFLAICLMFAIILSVSCNSKDGDDTDDILKKYSITVNTNYFIDNISLPVNTSETISVDGIEVGMSGKDVRSLLEGKVDYFSYNGCLFYKNDDNKDVVIQFTRDTDTVYRIEAYEHTEPERELFASIIEGMDVFDVVEIVGLPQRSATSGITSTDFLLENGDVFRIQWADNMRVKSVSEIID